MPMLDTCGKLAAVSAVLSDCENEGAVNVVLNAELVAVALALFDV